MVIGINGVSEHTERPLEETVTLTNYRRALSRSSPGTQAHSAEADLSLIHEICVRALKLSRLLPGVKNKK